MNLDVTVNGTGGYLVGWFDLDGNAANGLEHVVEFGNINDGVTPGLQLNLTGTGYVTGNTVYARFRLYDGDPGTPTLTGEATGGEVEDYMWSFAPNAVTLASLNATTGISASTVLVIVIMLAAALLLGLIVRQRRILS